MPYHAGEVDGASAIDEKLRTADDFSIWLCNTRNVIGIIIRSNILLTAWLNSPLYILRRSKENNLTIKGCGRPGQTTLGSLIAYSNWRTNSFSHSAIRPRPFRCLSGRPRATHYNTYNNINSETMMPFIYSRNRFEMRINYKTKILVLIDFESDTACVNVCY